LKEELALLFEYEAKLHFQKKIFENEERRIWSITSPPFFTIIREGRGAWSLKRFPPTGKPKINIYGLSQICCRSTRVLRRRLPTTTARHYWSIWAVWLTSAAANKYHSAWSLERVPHSHFFIYLKRMHSLEYISIEKEQNCQLRLVAYSPFLSLALWRAFPFCLVFPSKPCGQLLGSLHSLSRTEETVVLERENTKTQLTGLTRLVFYSQLAHG